MTRKKILTVVGTRPEIIRLSSIIKKLDQCFDHHLVHTNQNFDYYLKDIFLKDFNIKQPKMILAGINPHAGEQDTISKDDNKYLMPIIKKLNKKDILIDGPVSGDGIINKTNLNKYDVFIFTYHDQALIPFKIL